MNSKVLLPSRETLKSWVELIQNVDLDKNPKFDLKEYLPEISEDWYDGVMHVIDKLKITTHYQDLSLHEMGANIFYKIIKSHNQIDSNKRSGIIAITLFFLINHHTVCPPNNLKRRALLIAKSVGRLKEDRHKKTLTSFFIKNTRSF